MSTKAQLDNLMDSHIDTLLASLTLQLPQISIRAPTSTLHPPPQPPLYPTLLIKAERLQKVGANNKATFYI